MYVLKIGPCRYGGKNTSNMVAAGTVLMPYDKASNVIKINFPTLPRDSNRAQQLSENGGFYWAWNCSSPEGAHADRGKQMLSLRLFLNFSLPPNTQ